MSRAIHRRIAAAAALTGLACASAAGGQPGHAWPTKAVRIVVPFGLGGGTDIQGRLLAKKFSESMGQTFVVDNRAGTAGLVGADIVAKSPADGYTVLFTTASLAVNATLQRKIPFDPVRDLAPVSWVSSVPLVLVMHPSVPAKSVQELVALVKKNGGRINAASNGNGTTSHLSLEMLKQMAGIQVTHIPYKGGGPAMTALIDGEVDFTFAAAFAALPHTKSGRLKALAVTTAKRSTVFPNLPTMGSMYPGFESDNWYAVFVPAGTHKDVIAKLNAELVKALKSPDLRDFITKEGGDPVGSTPDELARYFRKEVEKYAKVIKLGKITPE